MDSLTEEIAAAAARWVVEDGLDYAQAKQRAAGDLARHQGRRGALPSNEQVEDAVREHLALFHADTQPAELRSLRLQAARWMERLAPFNPHLGGAVWRGTATRQSPILIDLYCDDTKAPEIALINEGVDFDSDSPGGGESVVLSLAERNRDLDEWVTVHLLVHDRDDIRGALRPDGRGQSWRADLTALRRRLELEP